MARTIKVPLNLLFLLFLTQLCTSKKCIDGDFETIEAIVPTKFNIGPNEEVCYRYSPVEEREKLALYFLIDNSYTFEILIYKSMQDIKLEESDYVDYAVKYKPVHEQFKEIDISEFDQDVYIIFRDSKYYYYSDYVTLYDSKKQILLEEGKPIRINHFMSNNNYIFTYPSAKGLKILYSSKEANNEKTIYVNYNNTEYFSSEPNFVFEIDDAVESDSLIIAVSKEGKTIENAEDEFSLVIYKDFNNYNQINKEEELTKNYIYINEEQSFYFYVDISDSKSMGTVNFKLDYTAYNYSNIIITSKFVSSDEEMTSDEFSLEIFSDNSDFPIDYDINSDEFKRLYYQKIDGGSRYKYILIELKINPTLKYEEPKSFTISLGEEVSEIYYDKIDFYNTQLIERRVDSPNYPVYFKMILDPDSKYLFTAPYQDNLLFIKGSLLNEDRLINKNILEDSKDLIVLNGISELTVRIIGYKLDTQFYIEKIDPNNVIIKEDERENDVITIEMKENECDNQVVKYIVGTYDKEEYSYGALKVSSYGSSDNGGEVELYYKNNFVKNGESLFPSLDEEKKELEKIFILDTHIDLFTIKCIKPGILTIRPYRKTFNEETHLILQNSIQTLELTEDTEILQLSTPIKNPSGKAYVSILLLKGNQITISADTPYVFENKTIKDNEVFNLEIDIKKYRMDQLAIKIQTELSATVEVIEVIPGEYTTYNKVEKGELKSIKYRNFYTNITPKTEKVKFKLSGLKGKLISYGIVKLISEDSNYLPLASKFDYTQKIKIERDEENIEIANPYYGEEDPVKKYQTFVFSILGEKDEVDYSATIELIEKKDGKEDGEGGEESDDTLIIVLSIVFLLMLLAVCIVLFIMKKKAVTNKDIEGDKEKRLPSSFTEYNNGPITSPSAVEMQPQ